MKPAPPVTRNRVESGCRRHRRMLVVIVAARTIPGPRSWLSRRAAPKLRRCRKRRRCGLATTCSAASASRRIVDASRMARSSPRLAVDRSSRDCACGSSGRTGTTGAHLHPDERYMQHRRGQHRAGRRASASTSTSTRLPALAVQHRARASTTSTGRCRSSRRSSSRAALGQDGYGELEPRRAPARSDSSTASRSSSSSSSPGSCSPDRGRRRALLGVCSRRRCTRSRSPRSSTPTTSRPTSGSCSSRR